jgi:hypothetical protein
MPASKPIQLILARQLASSMATAIMLFDAYGNLVFYNEPAEPILNTRFDETGEITAFPLEGGRGRLIGAVAMFWEAGPP